MKKVIILAMMVCALWIPSMGQAQKPAKPAPTPSPTPVSQTVTTEKITTNEEFVYYDIDWRGANAEKKNLYNVKLYGSLIPAAKDTDKLKPLATALQDKTKTVIAISGNVLQITELAEEFQSIPNVINGIASYFKGLTTKPLVMIETEEWHPNYRGQWELYYRKEKGKQVVYWATVSGITSGLYASVLLQKDATGEYLTARVQMWDGLLEMVQQRFVLRMNTKGQPEVSKIEWILLGSGGNCKIANNQPNFWVEYVHKGTAYLPEELRKFFPADLTEQLIAAAKKTPKEFPAAPCY